MGSANFIPVKGCITIGAFDIYHVFIDFDNEEEHIDVSSRSFITLGGDYAMKIPKRTINFKLEPVNTKTPV